MKKAVLLKLFLLVTCWSYAQNTYNVKYFDNAGWPGGIRTGFILNKTGWTEVDSGGTTVNAWSRTQSVPFNFLFFGQPVTHFKLSDNMILTFDTTDSRLPNNNMNLPTSVLPDQSIAAYWDQYTPSGAFSKVVTNVFGTAPKRQFWIVWYNYSQYGNPGASSYNAIVLEETTNKVFVVDQFSNNGSSLTATVGLQLSGTTAVQYSDSLRFLNMNSLSSSEVDYVEFKPRVITPHDVSADAIASPLADKQGCYTTTEPIEVAVVNYGTSSVSQVPVTVHVSGTVNQTFSTVYTGTILPNDTAIVNVGTLDMKQGGNFNFIARATYPTDGDSTNNAMVDTTRISVTVPLVMPIAPVNFNGYNGWNLAQVAPGWASYSNPGMPGGVYLSSWMESNALGTETIVLNQWSDMNYEWLVGPKFTPLPGTFLYFKAAVTDWQGSTPDQMGSDDSVRVMISTDCGASYQLLRALTAADQLPNTLTPFAIDLSAYAGQDINIAFYATDGPTIDNADYDIHLDDIQVKVPVATDAGVIALNNPLTTGCYSAAENVTVTIRNFGTAALTSVPVKVIVSGAIADTLTATYTGTLAPDSSAILPMGTIDMTTGGDYYFSAFSMLTGDGDASNDTLGTQMRTVIAPMATPLAKVDFTGFFGGNLDLISPGWSTKVNSGGIIFPGPPGGNAVWLASNSAQETHFGSTTARHNLFEDAVESWMIGPKVHILPNTHLTFKVAVTEWDGIQPSLMGSDDSVRVMVSTDCGISYQTIRAFTRTSGITNNLTAIDIDLSTYAGQDIIVAFYLTDGPVDDQEDYDFHFDDIQIKVPNPTDPGLNSLVSPATSGCFTNAESVEVTLVNNGTAAISNVPVQVLVSGAVTDTLNATYTGTLAPGASTVFVVGTLDMSTGGNYQLHASTMLAADGDTTNNVATASFDVLPTVALPLAPVTFTNYNGSNIDVLTNNEWKEAHGLNHPTNFAYSDWREADSYQVQQLGYETARVGLFGGGKNEWLIGPKFVVGPATHVTFDAAVTIFHSDLASQMGSDDTVHVMVSGDCGSTYKSIFTISAADSLTPALRNFDVDLSVFVGQEVIVAFYATNGTFFDFRDYAFHLDNILIKEKAVNDVGVITFMGPTNGCSLSQNADVTVKVKNFGSAAVSNVPLYFTVDGSPQFTDSIAGPIQPGDTATFTFTTQIDVSIAAPYQFTVATTLGGDASAANDTLRALVISAPEMPVTVTGPVSADFEGGAVSRYDFTSTWNEQAALRIDSAAANQSQYGMLFTGRQHHDWQGGDGRGATLPVDAWVSNARHHSSAQLCVDASSLGTGYGLSLAFDLKQTFSFGPGFSWFRVLVNGTQVSPDYQPYTMNADTFQTHTLDLSAYAGTSFQVTFQASNKYDKANGFGNGDEAWLDNIRLDAVTVGTAEALEANVALYPNPTSGMVQIALGNIRNASVAVYNLQGQLVRLLKAETSNLQLDLSDLATGAYLVKITTDKEVITKKLMLQK